jgi:ATP-binding cassette ChvD family protein
MAGKNQDYDGEVHVQSNIKIGYLPQEPELPPDQTVRAIVEEGIKDIKALLTRFDAISERFGENLSDDEMTALLEEQGNLQNAIEAASGWELDRKLEIAEDALRLPPATALAGNLSGGEKRRVALCRLLLSNPDVLLLDEPTNHLDAESVAWLERYLKEFKGTVVAITHDRYFLDNVAGWILELDRGHGIPFEGNYSSWLQQKEKRLAVEEKQEAARQRTSKQELEWVRANPKGRQAKSKARLAQFEELNSKEFQKRCETSSLYIPPGPRLGDLVIEANQISKSFADKLLIDNLSFSIPKGSITGIIGGNGAGKTTLFKMLAEAEVPDKGQIRRGETVQLTSVGQMRLLDESKTIWQEISEGQDTLTIGTYQIPSRAYVSRFNFKGTDQQKLIKDLSGGERNRVHLAKLLVSGGNVLLLDEPTNDLDVETLRALEEAILAFPGSILVISHDRWFLDRIATHILAFEDESKVVFYEGNYTDYEADRLQRLGESAKVPHRVKYKRLS